MKKIRLIELFSGIGAQASALERLGVDFEHYKTSEWEINAVASYKAIHCFNNNKDYSNPLSNAELTDRLFALGISTDGKKPMTKKQISRKSEEWKRTVFNNFKNTNNIGSIAAAKGSDLEIVDTDTFTYLLTYSFPCQDLSLAGKQRGMKKGSGTRSGMLWEVERLLTELEELPQVLLMENVTQVHSKKNEPDFNRWIEFLEDLGYYNYWQDLNAKDYGIAQNRNRTFMLSFLDNVSFKFPEQLKLNAVISDYLDSEVDPKFYITNQKQKAMLKRLIEC